MNFHRGCSCVLQFSLCWTLFWKQVNCYEKTNRIFWQNLATAGKFVRVVSAENKKNDFILLTAYFYSIKTEYLIKSINFIFYQQNSVIYDFFQQQHTGIFSHRNWNRSWMINTCKFYIIISATFNRLLLNMADSILEFLQNTYTNVKN